jgi:hypothetical protein
MAPLSPKSSTHMISLRVKRFGMKDAKPINTSMGTREHLDLDIGGKSIDQKVYMSMI